MSQPLPDVSAVIPTRFRSQLVKRAVLSALNQTHALLEIIVIIDGPDPETTATLGAIEDDRIRILALPKNVGGAEARNIGIQASRGQWIALLDDDDEWMPDKIETQLKAADQSDGASLITVPFIVRHPGSSDRVRPVRVPKASESYQEYIFDNGCGYQTSTLFCSRQLAINIPFQKGLVGCQDLDWVLRLSKEEKFTIIPAGNPAIPLAVFNAPVARNSVANKLSVKFLLDWVQPYVSYLGRVGYSRFLIHACLEKSIREGNIRADIARIVREWLLRGVVTPKLAFRFVIVCTMSDTLRRKIKDIMARRSRSV